MAHLFRGLRTLVRNARGPARTFSNVASFPVVDNATLFEEETMPAYPMGLFYPVRLGQIFQDRYQVVRKMGYGANSTVWMCRDLEFVWIGFSPSSK